MRRDTAVIAGEAQPAWILHATPYRETSLLLEALTLHDGRVGFVARGVRGARGQALRATLQPLQAILLSLRGRGELSSLAAVEVRDQAVPLAGSALLSAFYVNELMVRLLPRQQPDADLFWRYALCINALQDAPRLAWTLRCFERDLLQSLGYGLQLTVEAGSGRGVDADAAYRYEPERGAVRARAAGSETVSGAALLALAGDEAPPPRLQGELRRLLRELIRWRLGGRELRSWRILADLGLAAQDKVSGSELNS